MQLTHSDGCWEKGVEVKQVAAGGSLDDLVQVKDQLTSVNGVHICSYPQANHLLKKVGRHKCVLLRERSIEDKRQDRLATRGLLVLLAIAFVAYIDLPALAYGFLVRRGLISLALKGGAERGWDEHLLVASIGSTSRRALQETQALTIGCSVHMLRYDESVAPCRDCSSRSRPWSRWGGYSMFETGQSWDGGGWNSGYMRQEYWYDFFPFSLITAPIRSVAAQLGSWASAGLKALLSLLGMAETDSRSASNWGSFEDRMPPASMRNNATKGWWCAQQRLMAALADVLRTAPMLPEFLLIIDDDTFVNVRALRHYVHTKSPDRMIYAGDKHAGFPFLFGGGGHLLSRALMVPLKARIHECLRRAEDEWCEWHSDWILPACLRFLGLLQPHNITDGFPLFQQDCGMSIKRVKHAESSLRKPPLPSPARCDRRRPRQYRTRNHGGGGGGSSSSVAVAARHDGRPCPQPPRYHPLVVSNVSQAVSQLVTCHGVLKPAMMRDLHHYAC